MIKKVRRIYRFFRAIIIAAFFGIRKLTPPEILFAYKSIWVAVFSKSAQDASRTLYMRRMMVCRRCNIFDRKRFTCGSPLSSHPQLGCHCYLPVKNKMKSAKCWLRENSDLRGIGWVSKLMRKSWN